MNITNPRNASMERILFDTPGAMAVAWVTLCQVFGLCGSTGNLICLPELIPLAFRVVTFSECGDVLRHD
jgi:hypothetical protein